MVLADLDTLLGRERAALQTGDMAFLSLLAEDKLRLAQRLAGLPGGGGRGGGGGGGAGGWTRRGAAGRRWTPTIRAGSGKASAPHRAGWSARPDPPRPVESADRSNPRGIAVAP